MGNTSPTPTTCLHCRAPLPRTAGPGRPRAYCDRNCRRRAQRRRRQEGGARRPGHHFPAALGIAQDLQTAVARLLELEHAHEDLAGLLAQVRHIGAELDHYAAAAVSDARSRGADWEEVARAACQSRSTVRARWGEAVVDRLFRNRAQERSARPGRTPAPPAARHELLAHTGAPAPDAAQVARRASRKVASALSFLHRHSALSVEDVAERTGLSPSYVSGVLSGERLPPWTAVRLLAEVFGADPADLRPLWEAGRGLARPTGPPLREAVARLSGALRGTYLAAGCPPYERVARASAGLLRADTVENALTGRTVPCWETTSALLTALHAPPGDLRGLWEDVDHAFLVCLAAPPHDGPLPDHLTHPDA
ncbi:helix-turn-helix domain-containing protein [Streptomyces sp. TRM76323]|uniref:Helix-turn-helix domain-containing protein n=1 Tax=Streptomyces tamarix TaxID=3078565 RepID=A0ABU3QJ72_9ACTN|nr:helix-turn-helix domain-containing protein [Streptomyces tamarix]MDT9682825.1 helix-turn-helix domain-containing protein [Streptomyces tamarix]